MKKFWSHVTISFSGNYLRAESEEKYVSKLKKQFWNEFGIEIEDNEITDITSEEIREESDNN